MIPIKDEFVMVTPAQQLAHDVIAELFVRREFADVRRRAKAGESLVSIAQDYPGVSVVDLVKVLES